MGRLSEIEKSPKPQIPIADGKVCSSSTTVCGKWQLISGFSSRHLGGGGPLDGLAVFGSLSSALRSTNFPLPRPHQVPPWKESRRLWSKRGSTSARFFQNWVRWLTARTQIRLAKYQSSASRLERYISPGAARVVYGADSSPQIKRIASSPSKPKSRTQSSTVNPTILSTLPQQQQHDALQSSRLFHWRPRLSPSTRDHITLWIGSDIYCPLSCDPLAESRALQRVRKLRQRRRADQWQSHHNHRTGEGKDVESLCSSYDLEQRILRRWCHKQRNGTTKPSFFSISAPQSLSRCSSDVSTVRNPLTHQGVGKRQSSLRMRRCIPGQCVGSGQGFGCLEISGDPEVAFFPAGRLEERYTIFDPLIRVVPSARVEDVARPPT